MARLTKDDEEFELQTLLLKGLEGDTAAYRMFLDRLTRLLRAYIGRQLKTFGTRADDAEDIVQEALIAIHTRRHTYERDLPVTAWVRAIARYKLIDSLRAAGHNTRTVSLDDVDLAVDDTDRIEAGITVRQGMQALPEALRVPVQSIKLDGETPRELARRIGSQEVTVRVNVHRGLKALARLCGITEKDKDANR